MSIARRAIRETTSLTVLSNFKFVIRMAANITLARLLTPEIFGYVVMGTSILNIINLLGRWGIEAALVQERGKQHRLADTIFTITCGYGLLLAILIPVIGIWLLPSQEKEVTIVMLCLALPLIVKVLSSVSRNIMLREMRLKQMGMIELVTVAISAAAGSAGAAVGWGLWSLVIFHGLLNLLPAIGYFIFSSYHPRMGWCPQQARWFGGFGSKIFQASILQQFINDGDNLVVGQISGKPQLGIYNQAWKLSDIFQALFITTLNRSALATFSRKDLPTKTKALAFEFVTRCLFRFTIPFYFLLGYFSLPLVTIILGEQWVGAAPIILLLLPWSIAQPFFALNRQFNLAMGFPKKYLSSLLVMFTIFGIGIIPMVRWLDTAGAALTLDLMMIIGTGVIYYHTRKLLRIRLLRQIAPVLLAGGAALLALLLLSQYIPLIAESGWKSLIIGIPFFLALYGIWLIILERKILKDDFTRLKNSFRPPKHEQPGEEN